MSVRIGALFAGYGGLEMGVQAVLDGELAWYSEIDKGALKILTHHHPDVPNVGDITTVDWSQVEPVDILTGGSPCQDLSHAGKRAGMTDGTRSNLWVAMREAIAQLRPGLVVWENVRGAYSAGADSDLEHCPGCMGDGRPGTVLRALGRVLGDLSDLGYDAGWHGLRAADVGAPHGRFRVFVVATADPQRLGRLGRARKPRWRSVERAAPTRSGESAVLPTPTTRDHKGRNQRNDDTCLTGALLPSPRATDGTKGGPNQRGSSGDLMLPSAVRRLVPTPLASDAGPRGGTTGFGLRDWSRPSGQWGAYAGAIARWESLTRPAPTPTMLSKRGTPQLSPAFSEWMMGLPAGHVTDTPGITRNEALKALGNGVVPQQAEAALRFLLDALERAA